MLRIAGQTAGPIGLKFFCGNLKVARGCYRLKKIEIRNFFPEFFFKFVSTCNTAGPSAYTYIPSFNKVIFFFPI